MSLNPRLNPGRSLLAGVACLAASFLPGVPAAAAPDPLIAALVAQVDPARYSAHLAALVGQRATASERAAARAYIREQLESFGYVVQVDAGENVSAVRRGSITPAVRRVLGAHHDSVFGSPGADDNATGVAAVLEIARVLAGTELESSIELVSFGLEEVGLLGSAVYAADAASEGRDIRGAIVFDMIGFTIAHQIVVPPAQPGCFDTSDSAALDRTGNWIGALSNSTPLRDALLAARTDYVSSLRVEWGVVSDGNGLCFPYVPGFGNLLRRSDHVAFWDHGWPAMQLTDTAELRNPNYHHASDTISTLDLPFALDVTRSTLAFLLTAARPLPGPDLDGDGLANAIDNCPFAANAGQEDSGGIGSGSLPNGIGDACECGDVSGDGFVTIADASVIARSLLVPATATQLRPERCDVGGSRGCSLADAVLVRRALLSPPTATLGRQCAGATP